jgi:uncharacterized Tic20 family protein
MSYQDLKDLDELRKSGAITEEEYQEEKRKILSGTGNRPGSGYKEFFGMKENSYIALMHITLLAGFFTLIGFAFPIFLWLMNRENSKRVDANGKNIINFMLSWLIYTIGAAILCFALIGFPILFALIIIEIILIIMAAVKTNNGEFWWKYPLTITFLA